MSNMSISIKSHNWCSVIMIHVYIYTLKLIYVCVHKLGFICSTHDHSIWSLLQFFNEWICRGNIEASYILLALLNIYIVQNPYYKILTESQTQKRNLNLFLKFKDEQKSLQTLSHPLSLSSFIICIVQYVRVHVYWYSRYIENVSLEIGMHASILDCPHQP